MNTGDKFPSKCACFSAQLFLLQGQKAPEPHSYRFECMSLRRFNLSLPTQSKRHAHPRPTSQIRSHHSERREGSQYPFIPSRFAIYGRLNFLFRAEAFNVFNHTNLNNPNGTYTAAAFGTITGAGAARILQFALKFEF
jgi:hypothetical protein